MAGIAEYLADTSEVDVGGPDELPILEFWAIIFCIWMTYNCLKSRQFWGAFAFACGAVVTFFFPLVGIIFLFLAVFVLVVMLGISSN